MTQNGAGPPQAVELSDVLRELTAVVGSVVGELLVELAVQRAARSSGVMAERKAPAAAHKPA